MWRHNQSGFSLVEYIVALTLVALTALYAAPFYYKLADETRASAYTNELVAALTYARTQAVMRAQTVSLCSSDDGFHCTDTPWGRGYMVFMDNGAPGAAVPADRILKKHLVDSPQVTITLNRARTIGFSPLGAMIARGPIEAVARRDNIWHALAYWLDRFSPVAAAQAEPLEDVKAEAPASDTDSATIVFTICARHTGRTVRLSPQGTLKTGVTLCHT